MISPPSPSVHVTRVTCAPSAAYRAMVAPVPIDSSSGWACTSSSRRLGDEVTHVRVAVAGRIYVHDRKLPPAAGPDPALHPPRTPLLLPLPRPRSQRVPAQQGRRRPGDLPVAAGRGPWGRTADRRPGRAERHRRGPPARGAG